MRRDLTCSSGSSRWVAIGLALLLLVACGLPARAQTTIRADDDRSSPAVEVAVPGTIAINDATPGAIGDFVWDDRNGNGIQDSGEPGLAGVTVILKTPGGAIITTTTTNAQGLYVFSTPCMGTYKVEVDESTLPPGGYIPTICNAGSDDTVDNDCSPVTVTLASDSPSDHLSPSTHPTDDTTIDFGYSCGCTDQDLCTDDACDQASGCMHAPVNCDDQNICTDDSCDSATGCVHTLRSCDDHDLCTTDACDSAKGCAHVPVDCSDGTACTADLCSPARGCVHLSARIDDHNLCTADTCDPATGVHHDPVSCEDGNFCTIDVCLPAIGCISIAADCDDADVCTGDGCVPATGCTHDAIGVDDLNVCTLDSCDPESGPRHVPIDCDDDSACTEDICDPPMGCVHAPIGCNDNNSCTSDACEAQRGCTFTPIVPSPASCGACSGRIGDLVWDDLDRDGIQDAGEPGIPEAEVTLRDDANLVVGSTSTDAIGFYEFSGLCAGQYSVVVDPATLPAGFVASRCNAGGNDRTDNDCVPAAVTLFTDRSANVTTDFGFHDESSGSQGCSPGYWKNRADAWPPTGYATDRHVQTVFGAAAMYAAGSSTLTRATAFKGGSTLEGSARILLRAAASALLNASHPDVSYPRTRASIIADVDRALASSSRAEMLALAAALDRENNGECPLH